MDRADLWSHIGFVPQKVFLFSGTVASNLRYGDPDATDEELWHALQVAQAEDFVTAMTGRSLRADHPGGHQRIGRPEAASRDSPGCRQEARHLRVRRQFLGPRPQDRLDASGRPQARDKGRDGDRRRPAGQHHPPRRPDRGVGRGRDLRYRRSTRTWSTSARPTGRSSTRS